MDDHMERVRRRAYQIWLDEGRPEGREAVHWDRASALVAIEDRQKKAGKPVRRDADKKAAPPAPPPAVRAAKAIRAAAAAATGDEVKSPPAKAPSAKTKPTKRGKT